MSSRFPKPNGRGEGNDLVESLRDFASDRSGKMGQVLEGKGTTMMKRCATAAVVDETAREIERLPDSVRPPNLKMGRCARGSFGDRSARVGRCVPRR